MPVAFHTAVQAIEGAQPVIVNRAQSNPVVESLWETFRKRSTEALLIAPLIVRGEVIGTIAVDTDRPDRVFGPEDSKLMETVAGQLAQSIANARLFDEERKSRVLAERLQAAAQAISETLDLGEVLEAILVQLKHVLEYDQVMDHQRKVIYGMRQGILDGRDTRGTVLEMLERVTQGMAEAHLRPDVGPPDPEGLADVFQRRFDVAVQASDFRGKDPATVAADLLRRATARYEEREAKFGPERARQIERFLLLSSIDEKWKDHLFAMDALRSGIGMRAYAQEDPKTLYRIEGMRYFETMLGGIRDEVTEFAFKIRLP